MISTYSEYIENYISKKGLNGRIMPGEHHFVSVYLVPKLFGLNELVPDYVNPDGTKGIAGDIVYFEGTTHRLGIEVKLGTIRLTTNEFNSWIVGEDNNPIPNYFIGICQSGVILLPWHLFKLAYVTSVQAIEAGWRLKRINSGYGPSKSIDVLFTQGNGRGYFPKAIKKEEEESYESLFLEALADIVLSD